jgi:predicted ester cyclase
MSIDAVTAHAIADAYTAARNSGSPEAVTSFYAADGGIVINRGTPWERRAGVTAMAAGFFADVPDLTLTSDGARVAGEYVVYLRTFTGHQSGTMAPLRIRGWEEWDFDADGKVRASHGWFDEEDYARQVAGG